LIFASKGDSSLRGGVQEHAPSTTAASMMIMQMRLFIIPSFTFLIPFSEIALARSDFFAGSLSA
jgi:hypothetical protein